LKIEERPQTKEYKWSLEAEKGKETDYSELSEETSAANTLTSA
jgi:hypothetical protein